MHLERMHLDYGIVILLWGDCANLVTSVQIFRNKGCMEIVQQHDLFEKQLLS